jgi:DNA-directed RNA polymerase II subunit RPB1
MKNIYYLDTANYNYLIKSVDENGKVSWKKIEAVTKHLPINKDGTDTLIKVTTRTGKSVIATKGKSFLTLLNNKIVPIRGDDLEIGTCLPIMSKCLNLDGVSYEYYEHNINNIPEFGDIFMDKIISIEEVKPTKTYVYDFTVEDTKTFIISNGLCCMDSFHSSGVGGKGGTNIGVDRIKEVFSLSKNPKEPSMVIYFDKEHRGKKDFANKIASHIKFTTIKDLRSKIEIFYDPKPYEKDGFMEKDNIKSIFYTYQQNKQCCSNNIDGLPWLMRIKFDKEKLLSKEVSLLDIKSQFCFSWEKRYQDIKSIKREKRQLLEKISQLAVLSNTDNDDIPTIHLRFDMTNFTSSTLIDFMDMFVDEFKLKGMPFIEDIRGGGKASEERYISFDNPEKSMEKQTEYVVYTKGINMRDIRNILGIDLNRTYCDDIITVYEIFGIEAARNLIIREIINVLTGNGSSTNYQHISMFGDLMTNVGTLTSIDRHGLNKLDTDPLARASFEKTVDQLITAAVFNEIDYMKSVSSRIMAGLCIKGGTGLCNLVLDNELLENSEYTIDIGQLYKKTYEDITVDHQQDVDTDVFIPDI